LIVYFDTSALVATYVADACTTEALRARRAADGIATSLLAYAETLAAFGMLQRSRRLTPSARRLAESRFLADWAGFRHVRLEGRLLPDIRRVLAAHPLKGADSVHLASACVVSRGCTNAGIDCSFACDDRPLAVAARAEGLVLAW
jgi:predicted nucleic acid-binding protein